MAETTAVDLKRPIGNIQNLQAMCAGLKSRVTEMLSETAAKYMTPERLLRVCILAASRQPPAGSGKPSLFNCTMESMLGAMMKASEWGLEPNGYHAHIVPYGTDATLMLDYKGLVELLYRSGRIRRIEAQVVREKDAFTFRLGAAPQVEFSRLLTGDRGAVIGAYCLIEQSNGSLAAEYMDLGEIEAVRARSKTSKNGPWVTDWDMMARKTVLRRATKYLPLTPEIATVIDDDVRSEVIDTPATVTPDYTPGRQSFRRPAAPAMETAPGQVAEPESPLPQLNDVGTAPESPSPNTDDRAAFVAAIQKALAAGNDSVNRSVQKAMARVDVTELDKLHINTLADIAASI